MKGRQTDPVSQVERVPCKLVVNPRALCRSCRCKAQGVIVMRSRLTRRANGAGGGLRWRLYERTIREGHAATSTPASMPHPARTLREDRGRNQGTPLPAQPAHLREEMKGR